jgi:hypothetical protein
MGPLTDDHRCPRGRSRRSLESALTMVVGGAIAAAACYVLVDTPHGAVVVAVTALGAILANALKQAVRSGF